MTRFTVSVADRDAVGPRLTVMVKPQPNWFELTERAKDCLEGAKTMLQRVEIELNAVRLSDRTVFYLEKFFMLRAPTADSKEVQVVKCTLEKIKNGLNCDVTIKTGDSVAKTSSTPRRGAVKSDFDDLKKTKPYHKWVRGPAESTDGSIYLGVWRKTSAIRIEADVLMTGMGAHTLIHEASHKYAATLDNFYVDDDGEPSPPVHGDPGWARFLALTNADSLAWFVCTVGAGPSIRVACDKHFVRVASRK